ncbi:TolC family protein [Candidatus Manganitrophus noduliformans]|uniref:TolC family protein n=1 Tax=Candidatus Manganitrophus noduliformans TaxID=2606439 RepID=A0A7X6DNB2_9BACT|nr:TolC family protein [Candidatus Manganitrophus noduliformans]NKE70290.1 TolC family protein [Candidatus Manganitrophus noduliformans]
MHDLFKYFRLRWVLVLLMLGVSDLFAESTSPPRIVSLKEAIQLALSKSPEVKEAQSDVDLAKSKLEEVEGYRLPQLDSTLLIGPIPDARGDHLSSPDRADRIHGIGLFERAEITLIQPIYTFGKITKGLEAAGSGVKVSEAKVEQKQNEIILKVKEAYYGLLLARESMGVVLEVKDALGQAEEKVKELLQKEAPTADESDLLKLEAFSGEVERLRQEALKGERLALSALRVYLGFSEEEAFDIADRRLLDEAEEIDPLESYVEEAFSRRPEFKQLEEGLKARKAMTVVAWADYYPVFFLAGFFAYGNAPGRTDIKNPFISDPFNETFGGVAVGLKWHWDFGITRGKVHSAEAELNKLRRTREFAEAYIPLQVKKAYLERLEAEKSIPALKAAYPSARRWMISALANYDFGIGPAEEIFDALEVYAKLKANYFRSVYNRHLALANLAFATGGD